MRFTEIVYDVIVEEIKNKSTIQFLYKKWLGDDATEAQKEAVDNLISFFGKKRDALSLKQPAVKSFLVKFGAESGEYFDPRNLKDVTKYTLNQMKSLQREFIDDELNNNEGVKNIINNWYGGQPNEEQLHKGYKMLSWFNAARPKLSTELPEVISFLHRFDGQGDQPYFDPKNLKEIKAYDLNAIEGLYYEFHDYSQEMGANDNEAFSEGGTESTEPKREASKELWKGNQDVVINEGPVKVHFIPDQKTAIKYGYYAQEMRNKIGNIDWSNTHSSKMHWCVTGRGGNDSWSNLWGSYRRNRTFYFVIDESKNPETNENLPKETSKYYLGALQRYRNGWGLTSVLNDGGDDPSRPYTWDEIVRIYPQLAEHQDNLPLVDFDEAAELNVDNRLVNRVSENGGSTDFSKQTPTVKKAYINEGHPLKKASSWEKLNTYLRNLYIARTEEGNMYNSWQTMELIEAVKKTPQFYTLLKNKIEAICARSNNPEIKNKGISVLISKILSRDFEIIRTSIDNPNYQILRDKSKGDSNEKVGIYDITQMNWLTKEGVHYIDEYAESGIQLYAEKDSGQELLVIIYSKTGNIDPTSFFVVHPVSVENDLGEAHFVTYNHYQELLKKIVPKEDGDESDYTHIQGFNPETDIDIKETYDFNS